jgi:translation initiation factor 1
MAKKHPPAAKNVPVGESAKLTHNPFAGLAPAAPAPVTEAAAATESSAPEPPVRRGRLVLARETKHRGGKAVMIVRGFAELATWDAANIELLAKELKRALGWGGTVEDAQIIVQGDRPAQLAEWLRAQGFRVDGVTS